MRSTQTAAALLFCFNMASGIAATIFIGQWMHKQAKRIGNGDVASFPMRYPELLLTLIGTCVISSIFGLWLLFHIPKPQPCPLPPICRETLPSSSSPKKATIPAVVPRPKLLPASPVGPIAQSGNANQQTVQSGSQNQQTVQTMTNSPGGMQAGRDLTVLGNVPPPARVIAPEKQAAAQKLLKAQPGYKVYISVLGSQQNTELSGFFVQVANLFDTKGVGWTVIGPDYPHIGSFISGGEGGYSHGEGLLCASGKSEEASAIARRALAAAGFPCGPAMAYVPPRPSSDISEPDFYITIGTRIVPAE